MSLKKILDFKKFVPQLKKALNQGIALAAAYKRLDAVERMKTLLANFERTCD